MSGEPSQAARQAASDLEKMRNMDLVERRLLVLKKQAEGGGEMSDEVSLIVTIEAKDKLSLNKLESKLEGFSACHHFGTGHIGGNFTDQGRVETHRDEYSNIISFFSPDQGEKVEQAMYTIYKQSKELDVRFDYQLGYKEEHLSGGTTNVEINRAIDWIMEKLEK